MAILAAGPEVEQVGGNHHHHHHLHHHHLETINSRQLLEEGDYDHPNDDSPSSSAALHLHNESLLVWGLACGDYLGNSTAAAGGALLRSPSSAAATTASRAAHDFRFLVDVYVVSAICAFGFLGNALTIAVLRWDAERANPTSWLLQTLAIVDSSYLATCLFIQPVRTVADRPGGRLHGAFVHVEPYVWSLAAVAQTATVWMVLLVTIDRYIAVCKPFRSNLRSVPRAKVSVAVVLTLALLYNIPHFFERRVVYVRNDCTGTTAAELRRSRFTSSPVYFFVYKTLCHFLFRTFGPLLLLAILNHRLIVSMRTMRRRHDRMFRGSTRGGGGGSKGGRQRENITLMLVGVISVFIVCELPDVCLRLTVIASELVPSRVGLDESVVYAANSVVNMLLTVNSGVNFIVYCLVGKKFRRILRQRVCVCCPGAFAFSSASAGSAPVAEAVAMRTELQCERSGPEVTPSDHVTTLHGAAEVQRSNI